jgi:sterol desaturase/sphingolipid hydroxylase (fatty acid hydroxylase superfamily)
MWAEAHGFVVTVDAAFVHTPAWHVASLLIMLAVQDFFFYWAHRAMHTRLLFTRVHALHHRSSDPTALSAFSFTPYEAVIQAFPCILVYVLVPSEAWVKIVFLTMTFVMAVVGHVGFELFPAWLVKSAFGRVVNTTTHHHMHHHSAKHNFGLYVRLWDRLFGTEHPQYELAMLTNAEPPYLQAKLELKTEPG